MPAMQSPFLGPRGQSPIPPEGIPLNAPHGLVLPVDVALPNQIGLTSTVVTITRPDGTVFISNSQPFGTGYVYSIGDQSVVVFTFYPGILNQSGTWLFEIADPSIPGGAFIKGSFRIAIISHHENVSKALPPMKIQAFDDSCSLYTLLSPSTFETTPPFTLGDDWTDMTVAVNDGSNAYALWDEDVDFRYDPNIFDGLRGGVQVVLPGQSPFTSIIRCYSPPMVDPLVGDALYLSGTSGAFSANGTLLACVSEWDSLGHPAGTVFPRISRDFGQTWADVTGLQAAGGTGTGHPHPCHTRACFSQNAAVMYIHQYGIGVYKSTDGGVTWTFLTNSPAFPAHSNYIQPGLSQNSLRMRCSADGNTIAMIDWSARFYVSNDAGATWHFTDFPPTYDLGGINEGGNAGAVTAADFGMSTDGSKFLVMVGYTGPFIPLHTPLRTQNTGLWTSPDGITWTQTSSLKLPSANLNPNQLPATQRLPVTCALSPDGAHHLVTYTRTTAEQTTVATDASYTHGRTFVNQPATLNLAAAGGNMVAAHILPV